MRGRIMNSSCESKPLAETLHRDLPFLQPFRAIRVLLMQGGSIIHRSGGASSYMLLELQF